MITKVSGKRGFGPRLLHTTVLILVNGAARARPRPQRHSLLAKKSYYLYRYPLCIERVSLVSRRSLGEKPCLPWPTNEVRAFHTPKPPHTGLILENIIGFMVCVKNKGKLAIFLPKSKRIRIPDFHIKEVNLDESWFSNNPN